MNQPKFLTITCNLLKAGEKSRVRGAIGFGLASHWLKNWRVLFQPIIKCGNRYRVITFDCDLITALSKRLPKKKDKNKNRFKYSLLKGKFEPLRFWHFTLHQ